MDIFVLSTYQTKFGELWDKSLTDLIDQAVLGLFKSSKLSPKDIDIVFVANMLAQSTDNQGHLASYSASLLNRNLPAIRVEAACASGGVALNNAVNVLASGNYKTALIVGVEKMTDASSTQMGKYLMQAGSGQKEARFGASFPALYALIAHAYGQKYNLTPTQLAAVSVKNHYHGSKNKKAHFQNQITTRDVKKSPLIAGPLRLLDCSPITDGAAALVLTTDKRLVKKTKPEHVKIIASQISTDTIALQDRKTLTSLTSAKTAAKIAFKKANLTPSDIDLAEVHDCFTIAEIIALEDLGFYKPGQAKLAAVKGETKLGGKLPINTSGGLKAAGHPVGASGIKQIIEITTQLKNTAKDRQVKNAHYGLTHNVGGSGATCVINILTNL